MLEKHIQLMHGIKDPDVKELTEGSNEEETETEIKEDAKVRHLSCGGANVGSLFILSDYVSIPAPSCS